MADSQTQVKVIALENIKHGVAGTVTDYQANDELTVTVAEADQLIAAGAVKASDAVIAAVAEVKANSAAVAESQEPVQPTQEDITKTIEETQV